ncbi:hypothetical protein KR018_001680 [Drosophila ironensis]|nr:hypothetical protein KR018_001680 [Drosophila ironensis]
MCLQVCCGVLSLYVGSVAIGMVGIILSIVVFSLALFELISNKDCDGMIVFFAMATAIVYALSMTLLLFSIIQDVCSTLVFSFIAGILAFFLMAVLLWCIFMATQNPGHLVAGAFALLAQLYFLWVTISTWHCCQSDTGNC